MRRSMSAMWAVVAVALLSGCASPAFVGKWTNVKAGKDGQAIDLEMKADGTYAGVVSKSDKPAPFAGTWKKQPTGEALLTQTGGTKTATARMVAENRMVVDVKNDSLLQFTRQP